MLFPQELGNKALAKKREGVNKADESEKTEKVYAVTAGTRLQSSR